MRSFHYVVQVIWSIAALGYAASPGYFTDFSTLPGNDTFSFGTHYAVLHLDLINGLVGYINGTAAGQQFIKATQTWISAVHAQSSPPLSIFTRIYFSTSKSPELGQQDPLYSAFGPILGTTVDSPIGMIYPAFVPKPDYDVVFPKTRYYAGAGNSLEQILSSQLIDTVIVGGIRTSGVILATVLRLIDLNYNVYVITNNTIETPPNAPGIDKSLKAGVFPKLPANIITLERAIAALKRSGPAVY